MVYKLTKIGVEEGKFSKVNPGYSQTSDSLIIFRNGGQEKKTLQSIQELEEGWQVLMIYGMVWMNTSPIKKIMSKDDNKALFQTQTSVYELIKIENEE